MATKAATIKGEKITKTVMTVFFSLFSIVYIMPILIVLMNSFKVNSAVNLETFRFPTAQTFAGFANYINGMTYGNYPFATVSYTHLTLPTICSV